MTFLFASLFWGSVGLGYFVYGKKQRSWLPMLGGALIMAASYFVGSALGLTIISIALLAAIHILVKRGY